jgi:hypothetical protein
VIPYRPGLLIRRSSFLHAAGYIWSSKEKETYVCLRAAFNLLVAYVSLDELNIASVHPRADRLRLNKIIKPRVSPLAASNISNLRLLDRPANRLMHAFDERRHRSVNYWSPSAGDVAHARAWQQRKCPTNIIQHLQSV